MNRYSLLNKYKKYQGVVTPLGIINDQKNEVIFVLDKNILTFEEVAIHSLKNDETIGIPVNFISYFNNRIIIYNL